MNVTWCRRTERRRRRYRNARRCSLAMATTCFIAMILTVPLGAETSRDHLSTPAALFGVGIARCTFVDHTRSVLSYSTTPYRVLSPSRTLVTEIRYSTNSFDGGTGETPGALPVARNGGYPMIVFAHGYDVTPDTYAALLDTWVRAGFVVVAPFFPDESAPAVAAQPRANTEDDLANEPGDLAFVTRAVLAASANETSNCPLVSGLVEPSEIALAGHSDGAMAVGMLAYDQGLNPQGINYSSLRTGIAYRAVIILSGAEDRSQSYAAEASRPDLFVAQSLLDQCNPFREGAHLYNNIHQSNKWFLELQRAHHLTPFDGVDVAAFGVVSATIIRFLRISLEGAAPSTSLGALGNQRPEIARMYSGVIGPSLHNVPKVREDCGPN
ncbi:MAG: hypothetical protein JWM55_1018 [Acidimicrobiaceae bacterium]|nr:hypothetical protein [Acidimicrobiaceae bacterium]